VAGRNCGFKHIDNIENATHRKQYWEEFLAVRSNQ